MRAAWHIAPLALVVAMISPVVQMDTTWITSNGSIGHSPMQGEARGVYDTAWAYLGIPHGLCDIRALVAFEEAEK